METIPIYSCRLIDNMENLGKFQELIDEQRKKKEKISLIISDFYKSVFEQEKEIKINIEFKKDNVIHVRILEGSSLKFLLVRNSPKFIEEYKKTYPNDVLKIF